MKSMKVTVAFDFLETKIVSKPFRNQVWGERFVGFSPAGVTQYRYFDRLVEESLDNKENMDITHPLKHQ